ncbi:exo 1,3/1,4-beta-D-glucan glucohydrolase [Lentzea sp. NBRC 102530]|uniref:glycoside hydrolase family 3 protein n=1 Tax=Lentzea sp. NBRC 102530 TaxID=3032201 RepID=UPI0024A04DA0|nr:exo 1,3/1,4-beta-D-glucan glucohydrolase [Lentzea sp. NBRC 102530]GLY54096.1 beta-glucosidase [Lentzea sp. NBRC 102530]
MHWRSTLAAVLGLTLAAGTTSAAVAQDAQHWPPKPPKQTVIGQPKTEHGCARIEKSLPELKGWPKVESQLDGDRRDEARIKAILKDMTLAEKVGQMTQPEIAAITAEDVKTYGFGSVLNGGGSWPGAKKNATPQEWLALADAYFEASKQSRTKIPVIWGIDAVHGNNNVYGATVFPHNIGLGATQDPCLIRDINAATAEQIRATGQDWAFSPTLAVVQDDRWGRTYEGFSEDPRITRAYGYEAVRGLQDNAKKRISEDGVIATAKHFLGDGGTTGGKDQGVNAFSEKDMINLHGQGYYGALAAGAQSVMISFNSWTNDVINEGKVHGSKYVQTGILKEKMGFDGLLVGDWNGHGQVTGCTNGSCPQAVNAGLDIFMVPNDWKAFITNTIASVEKGEIPMARIDDAVTRILRVKLRAGVFEAKKPSLREHAGDAKALQHKELAREAVRESAVLLKNDKRVLPLSKRSKVLVVGKSADNIGNQTGGWTLSWQGTGNTNADFPNATSILKGIQDTLGTANVTFSATADGVDASQFDAVIAVIGETPYAEGVGDLGKRSFEAARLQPQDLAVLDKVSGKGKPVVTVYVGGRALYMNKEINRSDAFVAAWLPGTEGGGIADLLIKGRHNGFSGKLSYSWPGEACPALPGEPAKKPLFKLGYGLRDWQTGNLGKLDETSPGALCSGGGGGTATEDLEVFNRTDIAPYQSMIGSAENWGGTVIGPDGQASHAEINVVQSDVNVQQDALKTTWTGTGPGQVYLQSPAPADLRGYGNANSAIVFDVIVHQAPANRTVISSHCQYPCMAEIDATQVFRDLPVGQKSTVKIPVSCFSDKGLDLELVNTPFLVYTDGAFQASFANIRWVPKAGTDPDALPCT